GFLDQGRGLAFGALDGSALLDQALDRGGGFGGQGLLTADIGLGLAAPALGLGGGGEDPLLLVLQAGLGDGEALQLGGVRGLGRARRRQGRRRIRLAGGFRCCRARRLGNRRLGGGEGGIG